jgi:hypothetical protein
MDANLFLFVPSVIEIRLTIVRNQGIRSLSKAGSARVALPTLRA